MPGQYNPHGGSGQYGPSSSSNAPNYSGQQYAPNAPNPAGQYNAPGPGADPDSSHYSQKHSGWGKASKAAFDKGWGLFEKLGKPVNKLTNRIGSEAFWPTSLDHECDKSARILKSFCSSFAPCSI
jgi:hypothetical protein